MAPKRRCVSTSATAIANKRSKVGQEWDALQLAEEEGENQRSVAYKRLTGQEAPALNGAEAKDIHHEVTAAGMNARQAANEVKKYRRAQL